MPFIVSFLVLQLVQFHQYGNIRSVKEPVQTI